MEIRNRMKVGRKVEEASHVAFMKIINHMKDNLDQQFGINDIVPMMETFVKNTESEVYPCEFMKGKLG